MYKVKKRPQFDFAEQITLLREIEGPLDPAFLLQVMLLNVCCLTAFLVNGWWLCAAWGIGYTFMLFLEKLIVRLVPDKPKLSIYIAVLSVLSMQSVVFCVMPVYLWLLGPDVAKLGTVLLVSLSAMHTMQHRSLYPSILLCYYIPDAAVFFVLAAIESVNAVTLFESILALLCGFAASTFLTTLFFQAHRSVGNESKSRAMLRHAEVKAARENRKFAAIFDAAPIPVRLEDFSKVKQMVDQVGIADSFEFSKYLEANTSFITACAKQIKIIDVNRAALEQHGYERKSDMINFAHEEMSEGALNSLKNAILEIHKGSKSQSYETQAIDLKGKKHSLIANWSILPGHEEDYSRILLFSIDISELRTKEDILRHAQRMDAIDQLSAGVAHDLNNFFAIIRSSLELIDMADEFDRRDLKPIHRAVQRGANLVDSLLNLGRRNSTVVSRVATEDIYTNLRELLSKAFDSELTLNFEYSASNPTLAIDISQLEASIINLFFNAKEAVGANGAIGLSVQQIRCEANESSSVVPGEYVAFSITDNGSGMSTDTLKNACEPFYTTKKLGTGIGLSMAREFAVSSGGCLEIESSLGVGTSVTLFIPVVLDGSSGATHRSSFLEQPSH